MAFSTSIGTSGYISEEPLIEATEVVARLLDCICASWVRFGRTEPVDEAYTILLSRSGFTIPPKCLRTTNQSPRNLSLEPHLTPSPLLFLLPARAGVCSDNHTGSDRSLYCPSSASISKPSLGGTREVTDCIQGFALEFPDAEILRLSYCS